MQPSPRFSKSLSYLLRHRPESFGLKLTADGWAEVSEVATALTLHLARPVTEADVLAQVAEPARKQRFQLSGTRVRAVHGHSTATVTDAGTVQAPPSVLYHGTVDTAVDSIQEQGLLAGKRQFVHLSEAVSMAAEVGRRRAGKLVIFEVAAELAAREGLVFRRTTSLVWLTETVSPKYLHLR
jgi:putative RNA 2'-phosphotransferase